MTRLAGFVAVVRRTRCRGVAAPGLVGRAHDILRARGHGAGRAMKQAGLAAPHVLHTALRLRAGGRTARSRTAAFRCGDLFNIAAASP